MAHIIKNLWDRFCKESIVGKYIYANVAVYVTVALVGVFATLMNAVLPIAEFMRWFELPASVVHLLYQPWSLVTYMFIHNGFMHIAWNMFALYGFGRIFLNFYSTKHFIGVYFFGGIVGGLFFVFAYNLFPYFEPVVEESYLVGASAAVMAIVVASAVRTPNTVVNLFFFGAVRLATLAAITVFISMLLLSSENAGGNFAHIGGAVAGAIFAISLNKGHDVTKLINWAYDLSVLFATKVKQLFTRRPKMEFKRTSNSSTKHSADYDYNARRREKENTMNEILDKVKRSGYSSLTDEEKKRLFDSSQK